MSFHLGSVYSGSRKIIRLLAEGTTSALIQHKIVCRSESKMTLKLLWMSNISMQGANNVMNPLEV